MAESLHETAARHLYSDLMKRPGWREVLNVWQDRLTSGEVSYRDFAMYGQPHFGGWPPHQLACVLHLHGEVLAGRIGWQNYRVPHGPGPDRGREFNARALRESLPAELRVDVDMEQNLGDMDGTLAWSDPIPIWRFTGEYDARGEPIAEAIPCPRVRSQAPLEIGSTQASRTLDHLIWSGAVARWPYDSEFVQVMVNLGETGAFRVRRVLASRDTATS